MGLNKGENAGTIYLSVANGKLVQQHKQPTENTTERVNKVGKTVHEEFFRDLTGVITKIETKENDYGKQWQITFQDGTDKYMVQMPYSGRYSSSFLKALPNLKQGQPVKFNPWEMQDKNNSSKTITGVTLYQDDGNGMVKVPSAYTKEDPNGLPEMKKKKIKGKDVWDDTEMMEFLEDMAMDWTKSSPQVTDQEAAGEKAPF
jgi:hypothetical protein